MAPSRTPSRRTSKASSTDRSEQTAAQRSGNKSTSPSTTLASTADAGLPAEEVSTAEKARLQRPAPIFFGWLVLPFIVTFAHIVLSPYTKVEETPALHAVHDILKFGAHPRSIAKYEHVLYPGAVPRSIIPSLAIAAVCKPLLIALRSLVFITTGLEAQIITRLVLAAAFSHSLGHLAQTINLTSATAAKAFLLLSLSQFHVPYYAGRFLPNFLALPPVVLSFSTILRYTTGPRTPATKEYLSKALITLAFTAVVIRLELAPLVAAVAGVLLIRGDLPLVDIVTAGALGGFGGLAATAVVDGYFYRLTEHQLPFWPELSAFMFNITQGRAAEWGIMPPWHYVLALPKLLLTSLPLAGAYPVLRGSTGGDRLVQLLLIPSVVLVGALSVVGHKEWRFIVYVIPLLNVLAAHAAAKLWDNPSKSYRAARKLGLLAAVLGNLVCTALLTYISTQNYPGGEVGLLLQRLAAGSAGKVWIPAAALHTGATVYTLPPATLGAVGAVAIGKASAIAPAVNLTIVRPESSYEASRNPKGNAPHELYAEGYDWVVTDDWTRFEGDIEGGKTGWEVAGEVQGYRGVRVGKAWPFVTVDVGRRLAVMRRM